MFTVISKLVNSPFRSRRIRGKALGTDNRATTAVPAAVLGFLMLLLIYPQHSTSAQASKDQTARLERAAALIRENRLAEAERQLSAILSAAPNEATALNLLGTIRAEQGKLDEAEALFLRAVRSDSKFVGAHMNLAHLYLLKRQPEKTAGELNEVLRLDPRNGDAGNKLATLLLSQNRLDECISLVERLKQDQTSPTESLLALGEAYLKKGDSNKAEDNYRLALNQQGDNVSALVGLAQISQNRGDAKAAALYVSRARESVASSPALLYRLALVDLKLNLDVEAVAALDKALELKPEEPSYLLTRGILWLRKLDLFEAEKVFRSLLKVQPNNAEGQMYLGYVLLKQKRVPEAREWLEKSVKTETSGPESYYYLGLIAQEQNDHQRAVEWLQKAVQLTPSYVHAHVALGASYVKLKDYARAQQELELAVKLNPEESKAHYNLALLYARLKNQQKAQEEMRIVERLKSTGSEEGESIIAAPSAPVPR